MSSSILSIVNSILFVFAKMVTVCVPTTTSPFVVILDVVISTSISTSGAFVTLTVYVTASPSAVSVAPEILISVPGSNSFPSSGGVGELKGSVSSRIVPVASTPPTFRS